MRSFFLLASASAAALSPLSSHSHATKVGTSSNLGRRQALGLGAAVAAAAPLSAAAAEPSIKVYFGAGCFWHVQHEFVLEEQSIGRRKETLTSMTGYAGGQRTGDGGAVCYHNPRGFSDYGKYGHTEVVQLEIPESQMARFSKKYFDLFGTRGYRHDPQDRGGEYRSALGLPGGVDSPLFDVVRKAALESPGGMKLFKGKGDEPDTIGDKAVLVYDSNKFPFYPAELYHQFHNDFIGAPYGKQYNDLLKSQYEAGKLKRGMCPDMEI